MEEKIEEKEIELVVAEDGGKIVEQARQKYPKGASRLARLRVLPRAFFFALSLSGVFGEARAVPPPEPIPVTRAISHEGISTMTEMSVLEEQFFVPEIINGVETYGDQEPLNQEQLSALIRELNSKYERGETEMKNDRYYMTQFISSDAYHPFPIDREGNTESPQSFLVRHALTFDQWLKTANPPLEGGFQLRRIIVHQDSVYTPASWYYEWLSDGLKDSDGAWYFFNAAYDPREGYYDWDKRIDNGLLHEVGHTTLHLKDQYPLGYSPPGTSLGATYDKPFIRELVRANKGSLPLPLEDIPPVWQSYLPSGRNDELGNSLMDCVAPWIGNYAAEQLARRVKEGWSHDVRKCLRDYFAMPGEIPLRTLLDLGPEFSGAQVEIFRTKQTDGGKILGDEAVVQGQVDQEGRVDIGSPFIGCSPPPYPPEGIPGYIPREEATLFIKVKKEGKIYFRWEDIRAFNLAFWRGYKKGVVMKMNLASAEMDPSNFDWTINYSGYDYELPYKVFLPQVQKSN